jgi:hypothetical protein
MSAIALPIGTRRGVQGTDAIRCITAPDTTTRAQADFSTKTG